jgi:hypothetical protein
MLNSQNVLGSERGARVFLSCYMTFALAIV